MSLPEIKECSDTQQGDKGITDPVVLESLIPGCLQGDRLAMRQLYDRSSGRIYALMVRMVGRQDADDLTQHCFLRLFEKLNQFNGQSKLETWFYRLAANEALMHLRRRKCDNHTSFVSEPAIQNEDAIIKSEEAELLEQALLRLDPDLRTIISLQEEHGLSYREIAESLEIPEGTVGSRLNRARKELHEELLRIGWV